MKYLILSDVHGNLEALQASMLKVRHIRFDKYISLGDLVGYGANPNEVANLVRKMDPIVAIRGNHDKVAVGISDGTDFNYVARDAALWTRNQLSSENREYVSELLQGPVEVDDLFDIVHGAPWDEEYYIFQWQQAYNAIQRSDRQITFFGHTHIPVIWDLEGDTITGEAIFDGLPEYSLEENKKYLINPGSIGQPRDGNPKASLAIFDSDQMKMEFLRIDYNIKLAQEKIRQAELDDRLADRLAIGR